MSKYLSIVLILIIAAGVFDSHMAGIVRNKSGDERAGMTEATSLGAVTLEAVNGSGGDTVIGAKTLSKGQAAVDFCFQHSCGREQ